MTEYHIENAKKEDLQEVISLVHHVVDVSLKSIYPQSVRDWFYDYHSVEHLTREFLGGAYVFMVRDGGKIIATATYNDKELKRVFIDPDYQKQGLGKRLMAKLEQAALELGDHIVCLYANPRSWKYYEALGYHTTSIAAEKMDDGEYFPFCKMIKQLDINPYTVKEDNLNNIIDTLSNDAIAYFGGKNRLLSHKDIICACATKDGKTIGIALGKKLDCDTVQVINVWVEPKYRKQYVGDSLFFMIEDKFPDAKKYIAKIDNENSIAEEFFSTRCYVKGDSEYTKLNAIDLVNAAR